MHFRRSGSSVSVFSQSLLVKHGRKFGSEYGLEAADVVVVVVVVVVVMVLVLEVVVDVVNVVVVVVVLGALSQSIVLSLSSLTAMLREFFI
jgi:hypothetical protein